MSLWRRDKDSSSNKNESVHDRRQKENEKNQRKHEDGLKKGYIDKAEWERIDREYEK